MLLLSLATTLIMYAEESSTPAEPNDIPAIIQEIQKVDEQFSQLPETSKIRNACSFTNKKNTYCDKIRTFLYCAKNYLPKEHVQKTCQNSKHNAEQRRLIAIDAQCSSDCWNKSFLDHPYRYFQLYSRLLCEQLDLSPEESTQEMADLLHVLETLQEQCHAQYKESKNQEKDAPDFF